MTTRWRVSRTHRVTGTANLINEAVNLRYGLTGNHGFRIDVPSRFRDGKATLVFVSVEDPWTMDSFPLEGSPFVINTY